VFETVEKYWILIHAGRKIASRYTKAFRKKEISYDFGLSKKVGKERKKDKEPKRLKVK